MFQPFGRWLVVAVGAAIFGAGLYRFYEVYKADFSDELKTGDTSLWEEVNAARRTSRLRRQGRSLRDDRRLPGPGCSPGRSGRGQGLGGALETLARQPFGPYILSVVAAGLVAHGAFMFAMARYRRIEPA